jgi:hypothetical protein
MSLRESGNLRCQESHWSMANGERLLLTWLDIPPVVRPATLQALHLLTLPGLCRTSARPRRPTQLRVQAAMLGLWMHT